MNNNIKKSNKFKAFTLAEVLVVLAIIGVISALTIPTLITSYQKQQTVEKFKKTYSVLVQAIKKSEIDNGAVPTWPNIGYGGALATNENFMNQYIKPYLSYIKSDNQGSVILSDGIKVSGAPQDPSGVSPQAFFIIDINADKLPNMFGKDKFELVMCSTGALTGNNLKASWMTRDKLINGYASYADYGCSYANPTGDNNIWCSSLIMYDGWKISDDYPW